MPTVANKTFLVGLVKTWHILTRYIVKHRATMGNALSALGVSAADIAAINAAFDAIVAVDSLLKTITGY